MVRRVWLIVALLGLSALTNLSGQETPQPKQLMPQVEDYTRMWWADGFPAKHPGAPWIRVIETGRYAFALDTTSMKVPHFGPISGRPAYADSQDSNGRSWSTRPAAELSLNVRVDGTLFCCVEGGQWTKFTGPRLIESGRFLQRADVTDLVFRSDDGRSIGIVGRFETVAWTDQLTLVLAARPPPSLLGDWKSASIEIRLANTTGELVASWHLPEGETWAKDEWKQIALTIDPIEFKKVEQPDGLEIQAFDAFDWTERPVNYDPQLGGTIIDLDSIRPMIPARDGDRRNDAFELVRLTLSNSTEQEQIARLIFEKKDGGILHNIGSPLTGMSAVIRDASSEPLGIPVQLSKNWHTQNDDGLYAGSWWHGVTQLRLPPNSEVEIELALVYGHWGGVPAASHSQLCLIGWGSNQLWNQAAIGSWGESLCFDPDQIQSECLITDVRPLMVGSMKDGSAWGWTNNVGGGDFFRLFNRNGHRIGHSRVSTTYHRQGPCLTEVTFAGIASEAIVHAKTVSLARSDDMVRGTYRIRMDVTQPVDFSRFVIFQLGADSYSYTTERKLAVGNETGLVYEWKAKPGARFRRSLYRTDPIGLAGRIPWVSMHEAESRAEGPGAWANRGFIIRSWSARLGGKEAGPWIAERGQTIGRRRTSTIDLIPPPGVEQLVPGDFVEATIEQIVIPQFAADYYGPNESLKQALQEGENTWRLVEREANGNDRQVEVLVGELRRRHPDIRVQVEDDAASLRLTSGLGYVPFTFTGLENATGYVLKVDGVPVDQSVHGNDFWQTDYDPATGTWSQTYNVPISDSTARLIEFGRAE